MLGFASANLIKPAETHHFIWRFLFFGLALIWWWLPALWLGRWVKGGGSIVCHADSFQTKQPPPSLRLSIWHSRAGIRSVRESSCRQMFAPLLWTNTGRASAGILRFVLYVQTSREERMATQSHKHCHSRLDKSWTQMHTQTYDNN